MPAFFRLFHPDTPAFQCGHLTRYPRDARVLEPSNLGGSAGAFFNHALYAPEGEFVPCPAPEAARKLLVLLGYDVAGIKSAAPTDPAGRGHRVYGAQVGHVAQLAHMHVVGRTLKDTLLLNLPPQPRSPDDAPVWERPTPDAPMTTRTPAGRLDALTWPSRRIRLHAGEDGRVDRVAWHDGDRMTDLWKQASEHDPMSRWRTTKTGRWAPSLPTDSHGLIVPWRVAELVLDPDGTESGRPARSGAAQHLARVLDQGELTNYGPLRVEASAVQHTTKHRSVISGVASALVPLANGRQLADPDGRAGLAAAARAATTYQQRTWNILRKTLPQHQQAIADRVDFMALYDRWDSVAQLLADAPVDGRTTWRRMLRTHVTQEIEALPLPLQVKAAALVQARGSVPDTRRHGEASQSVAAWKNATVKAGRPTARALTAFGETKSLSKWGKDPRCMVSYSTLRDRVDALKDGDDPTLILTTPPTRGKRRTRAPAPDPSTDPHVQAQSEGRHCHHCGTLLPPDGTRSRCADCLLKRSSADFVYRKEIADAIFPESKRTALLERLSRGELLPDVCDDLDLTPNRIHGYAAYDATWRERLDSALMAGRDPDLDHGTESAYRHGACRCPECRTAREFQR
ncbi:type I-E CRISPR-associated protein Cse1/CasA [Streptomyces sp. NBC_00470]|uniref:type I-E CRISPR-associated protein Cse1/CasA n=1 Tax=Streptomyces sp. NBC_00470 TaxID=2975753 RepID=UPI002F90D4B5